GDEDGAGDQDAAHGGDVGLAAGLGAQQLGIGRAGVADFHPRQETDRAPAQEQDDQEGQAGRGQGAKLDSIEHLERPLDRELDQAGAGMCGEEVEHQAWASSRALMAGIRRSRRMRREPLRSTMSPGARAAATLAAPASLSSSISMSLALWRETAAAAVRICG